MFSARNNFVTNSGVVLLAIGILSLCDTASAANPKSTVELMGQNGTNRVVEYIDPFAMTVTTYSVRNSASNGSAVSPAVQPAVLNNAGKTANVISAPGNPTTNVFLRPLIRVPSAAPCRSPSKPF